jgi:two-component system NtrC family response regulator
MSFGRILVVEDDESLRRVTQAQLENCGYDTSVAADVPEALKVLARDRKELVITDLNLPGPSGLDLLKQIHIEYPETTVVLVTAYGSVETAVEAIKGGAYDYITKPVHPDELRALVARVMERYKLIEELRSLRSFVDQKYGFEGIIGRSPALMEVLDSASRVAPTDATVLILGETGTGKELIAKGIHYNSLRRDRPFMTINCGAIPAELLESELFGHVKGSFTGAISDKKGKVEMADTGTLFLDEIGEMSLDLQVRVLRLLQEREIEKVGATSRFQVDVRIIAATHRDLEALIAEGKFREDLYYRLAVIPISLPSLRERRGDVEHLVSHFLERHKMKHNRSSLTITPDAMKCLINYRWPGNVRELENLLERLVLLARTEEVGVGDLPANIRNAPAGPEQPAAAPSQIPAAAERGLNAMERDLILRTLQECDWNQSKTARKLAISRKTLLGRMAKHGLAKDGVNGSGTKSEAAAAGGGSMATSE